MYTIQSAYQYIKQKLSSIYDEQEATAIAHEYMEHLSGLTKLQRLTHKETILKNEQEALLEKDIKDLISGKPMQYVIGKAWFMGNEFMVNKHVLIPRPETEELVQWVVNDYKNVHSPSIFDIGTGSGCIPISLKLLIPHADISSCDISDEAISVAKENAQQLNTDIKFKQADFLDKAQWAQLGEYDVIVSNPPYIPNAYRSEMHINVKEHEPSLALFVPDNDPLLFYKAIADLGSTHLKENGSIYCELHADHAEETKQMFVANGYDVVLKEDMFGKPRMLKASK